MSEDKKVQATAHWVSLVSCAAILSTIPMIVWVFHYSSGLDGDELEFNLHPLMMTLGFVFLMTMAMLSFRTHTFLGMKISHRAQKTLHIAMHSSAVVCIIMGMAAILKSHGRFAINNWHSGFGMMSLLFYAYNFLRIGGIGESIFSIFSATARPIFMKFHTSAGIIAYILGMCAILTGTWGHEVPKQVSDGAVIALWVYAIFVAITALGLVKILSVPQTQGSCEESSLLEISTNGSTYQSIPKHSRSDAGTTAVNATATDIVEEGLV